MNKTMPIAVSSVLVLIAIFTTLVATHGNIDTAVGAGIGSLLFISLTATAILAE